MIKQLTNRCVHLATLILLVASASFYSSTPAYAEYLGFPSGRSADVASHHDKSVEAGFLTGDISDVSYQHLGARFNFRTSPELMVFGDVTKADVEDADGTGFGAGFFYQIKGVTKENDFAVKVSFHTIELEEDGEEFDDGTVIAVEALFSGKKIGESDLQWYANAGIHKFNFDTYDETEIGFGGGVFMDTSFGQFYAGADLIDELTFGLGVRYNLQ